MKKSRLYRIWCWFWYGHTKGGGAVCWKCQRCDKDLYN